MPRGGESATRGRHRRSCYGRRRAGRDPQRELRLEYAQIGVYGDRGAGQLYEDDGETLGHTRGAFLRRRYEWARTGAAGQFTVAAPEGAYRPAARDLILEVRGVPAPARVSAGGQALDRLAPDASGAGWTVDDAGVLRVRVPDRFAAMTVDVAF